MTTELAEVTKTLDYSTRSQLAFTFVYEAVRRQGTIRPSVSAEPGIHERTV